MFSKFLSVLVALVALFSQVAADNLRKETKSMPIYVTAGYLSKAQFANADCSGAALSKDVTSMGWCHVSGSASYYYGCQAAVDNSLGYARYDVPSSTDCTGVFTLTAQTSIPSCAVDTDDIANSGYTSIGAKCFGIPNLFTSEPGGFVGATYATSACTGNPLQYGLTVFNVCNLEVNTDSSGTINSATTFDYMQYASASGSVVTIDHFRDYRCLYQTSTSTMDVSGMPTFNNCVLQTDGTYKTNFLYKTV